MLVPGDVHHKVVEPFEEKNTKKTYKRRSITVSTEKKSHANVLVARARMKSRHRSLPRRGAGPRPARFKIRRIVAPLTLYPRFFTSPRIRSYPHEEFSRANPSHLFDPLPM